MRRKIKLSFEELGKELSLISANQITSVLAGQDPTSWGNDCFLHAMRGLYKSINGIFDNISYNQFNVNLLNSISHFENTIPNLTNPSSDGSMYDGYTSTFAAIYNEGVRHSVGYSVVNSMFDNVTAMEALSQLSVNAKGIINTGGHAVTLTDSYLGSDGIMRYTIVDEQNPSYSKTYTQEGFNSQFGGVHAIYIVGAQDWYNQAGASSYSPTDYPTTGYEDNETTTTIYDNNYTTTEY